MSDVEKSADRLFEHTVEEAILKRSNTNFDIITEETRKSKTPCFTNYKLHIILLLKNL